MTYCRAISFRMISTRSNLARASDARALLPFGHSRDRRATTFCSAARAVSTRRMIATRRAIRSGFPCDMAKISAATISAADSSVMLKFGLRFENDNRVPLKPAGITHGQALRRTGQNIAPQAVNHGALP